MWKIEIYLCTVLKINDKNQNLNPMLKFKTKKLIKLYTQMFSNLRKGNYMVLNWLVSFLNYENWLNWSSVDAVMK